MKKRIYHVLLISSAYDAFMLEDDGRIDEQIFNEYVSLNLRYPPQFILASSEEEAFEKFEEEKIDLIITMLSAEETDTFGLGKKNKTKVSKNTHRRPDTVFKKNFAKGQPRRSECNRLYFQLAG